MLGLFTRLSNGHASPAVKGDRSRAVRHGLDLQAAIAAHRGWRIRLENVLAGRSTEVIRAEELCFDDRCALGRWIHGPASAALGHLPDYHKLVADHRKFHHAASNVVALAQVGRAGEALRIFEGPYDAASSQVIAALERIGSVIDKEAADDDRVRDFPSLKRQLVRQFTELTGPAGEAMALRLERAGDRLALQTLLPAAVEFVIGMRGPAAGSRFMGQAAAKLQA